MSSLNHEPAAGRTLRGVARALLAGAIGLAGFIFYVGLVLRGGDVVNTWHWTIQLVFYAIAGVVWVWPARWLMVWGARGG